MARLILSSKPAFLRQIGSVGRFSESETHRLSFMRLIKTIMVIALVYSIGCESKSTPQTFTYIFCFDKGFEGWIPRGIDLDNPPVDWQISLTDEMATCGPNSLKLRLNNVNDKAKIWIEREFDAVPNSYYQIILKFDFATADVGEVNLWRIIAGATDQSPQTSADLPYRDETAKKSDLPQHEWTYRTYCDTVEASREGSIYIVIGVWGTHEVERTYYIDKIVTTLGLLKPEYQQISDATEQNLSEWRLETIDLGEKQ